MRDAASAVEVRSSTAHADCARAADVRSTAADVDAATAHGTHGTSAAATNGMTAATAPVGRCCGSANDHAKGQSYCHRAG